jgi:hypothetical protein
MRRRSRAGGKPAKSRRGKQAALKQRNAPKSGVRRISYARQEADVAWLTRERDEALEQVSEALKQQTAASEVLRLISGVPGTKASNAARTRKRCCRSCWVLGADHDQMRRQGQAAAATLRGHHGAL